MLRQACVCLVVGAVVALVGVNASAESQPEGQLTIAFDTTIAPTYLDPAETTGIAAPFVFLYALHDALLKPLPGNLMAPCLGGARSHQASGAAPANAAPGLIPGHLGDPAGSM